MSALYLGLCAFLLSLLSSRAAAEPPDIANELRGVRLAEHASVFEDRTGALELEQVLEPAIARQFKPSRQRSLGFGYSNSAYWIRFVVRNSGGERPWLLELAYPHIDDIRLYVPSAGGGYDQRRAGDLRSFAERDIAYRNFVFILEQPGGSEHVYYLRAESSGALNLPLLAWTMNEFVEHQHLDWAGLCVFYGVILVMTFYSVCLYLFTRERSYLVFAGAVLTMGMFQLTFVGHTFQFLIPNEPRLAQHLIPLTMAICLVSSCLLKRYYLPESELPRWYRRVFDVFIVYSLGLLMLAVLAPYRFSIRVLVTSMVSMVGIAFVTSLGLLMRKVEGSRVFFFGWAAFWCGVVVAALNGAGILTTNAATQWSVQIGMTVQFVLLSSGLAGKLNSMRTELGRLNRELSQKVEALEDAVVRAEEATQQAEALTRVKDEFMATMSHELRTPLNTIINIPQGLVEDFPLVRYAVCSRCTATFELEAEEYVATSAPCPDCQARGSLNFKEVVSYAGRPERTSHYLSKIERSGTHLLRVMNAILDEGKTDAGQFKLLRERFDLVAFVRDVADEMADLAERTSVTLVLAAAPESLQVFADPLRIRQVLINLLGNAIKFSKERGTVSISVGARIDSCVVAVRDEGIGIAKDKLDKVFQNFEQVHGLSQRGYGGTGLGLSISRSLVRRHGGDVWVQSELGRGSIFFFSIPHGTGVSRARELQRPSIAAR